MFVTKSRERELAREMRADGASLRTIARALGVALSTVSLWVRDVEVPPAAPPPAATSAEAYQAVCAGTEADAPEADAPRRLCRRCDRMLPETAFNRYGERRQWWCRSCFREYYRSDRDRHRARNQALKAKRVDEARAFVRSHLERAGCADCGETDLVLLEFDHLRDKTTEVATMVNRGVSIRRLREEIARCDVVCCACHRLRTAHRAGWRRLMPRDPAHVWRSERQRRNFMHLFDVLEFGGCEDCGERDVLLLDFDHVGEKHAAVTRMAQDEVSLRRLKVEIAQCEVRCVRCHRRRTASERGYWRAAEIPPERIELSLQP